MQLPRPMEDDITLKLVLIVFGIRSPYCSLDVSISVVMFFMHFAQN